MPCLHGSMEFVRPLTKSTVAGTLYPHYLTPVSDMETKTTYILEDKDIEELVAFIGVKFMVAVMSNDKDQFDIKTIQEDSKKFLNRKAA